MKNSPPRRISPGKSWRAGCAEARTSFNIEGVCLTSVVPLDDRRLTVLHRREYGPSSICFAATSRTGFAPVAVRRAEQFDIGSVFRTEETRLVGRKR
jgi:hypothetical protein